MKTLRTVVCFLLSALALAACSDRFGTGGTPPAQAFPRAGLAAPRVSRIQHVIFIIQENRSFDNLFYGYPGADTVASGKDSAGKTVRLVPIPLEAPYDISHGVGDFLNATDGSKMDGFDKELVEGDVSPYRHPQYGFVPKSESKLYFEMARRYVLGDRMFTSQLDASYVAHQFAVAGQANAAVDFPNFFGCEHKSQNVISTLTLDRRIGPTEPTCQDYQTLGDELDASGHTWRYYAFSNDDWIWQPFASIHHIRYGSDWKQDIASPETRVLSDIQAGALANVVWVTPSSANSDHSSSRSNTGPEWVASIVNAVGMSPYWKSTAIFVMWDEWGGWYDHVPPPYADFDGLGIRVPLLVISPFARKGYVSHVQYETGSVLRFIENQFGLAQLAASDLRANDPAADCFDFTQKPRLFHKLPATQPSGSASMRATAPERPDTQ